MASKILSAAIIGLNGEMVDVEVDVLSAGLHNFTIVGLPDTAVKESRDRVSSAIRNSGFKPAHQCGRITVNLAPADLPKATPIYDLPIAIGLLLSSKQISFDERNKLIVGELSLNGKVRAIQGILPLALFAKEKNIEELYIPSQNAAEASVVTGVKIIPVDSLFELVEHLTGRNLIAPQKNIEAETLFAQEMLDCDMVNIKGQEHAKRALEIAAAGGHNILLSGPPGSGKTLLARAMTTILPKLSLPEALEITKIYSVAGKLPKESAIVTSRPYRAPHHSASSISLVGGGSFPKPGEISLAHRGVLFLDEFAEFPKHVLENLRQPLEDGTISISRVKGSLQYPARFILVAAMNPCPCGNASDIDRLCSCSPSQIMRYQQKISGPIIDRIDLHVEVPRLPFEKMEEKNICEDSSAIRKRVESARSAQRERFNGINVVVNADMGVAEIKKFCSLDQESKDILQLAVSRMHLSARSYHRIIKLARTIADLEESEEIKKKHIAEAIQFRAKTE